MYKLNNFNINIINIAYVMYRTGINHPKISKVSTTRWLQATDEFAEIIMNWNRKLNRINAIYREKELSPAQLLLYHLFDAEWAVLNILIYFVITLMNSRKLWTALLSTSLRPCAMCMPFEMCVCVCACLHVADVNSNNYARIVRCTCVVHLKPALQFIAASFVLHFICN